MTYLQAPGNGLTAVADNAPAARLAIDALSAAALRAAIAELCALLEDAIDSNASVGFVLPVADGELEAFWHEVALDIDDGMRHLLVARDAGAIIGTVALAPSMKSNQAHRAEVQKLLVLRRARGRGVGRALMQRIEKLAAGEGRWLLTLDTRAGSEAERLYRRCGYVAAGAIPDYATDADRTLAACTFFYKALAHP
ncbi:MAG: GNAT family N-acetyltransferase [Casimicrobiaceae bacterium]